MIKNITDSKGDQAASLIITDFGYDYVREGERIIPASKNKMWTDRLKIDILI